MRILRKYMLAGASEDEGVAVVIDVYRAFTCAALMMYLGATGIVLVADPEDVLKLKSAEGYLAVGEVRGKSVFSFAVVARPENGLLVARRVDVGA